MIYAFLIKFTCLRTKHNKNIFGILALKFKNEKHITKKGNF